MRRASVFSTGPILPHSTLHLKERKRLHSETVGHVFWSIGQSPPPSAITTMISHGMPKMTSRIHITLNQSPMSSEFDVLVEILAEEGALLVRRRRRIHFGEVGQLLTILQNTAGLFVRGQQLKRLENCAHRDECRPVMKLLLVIIAAMLLVGCNHIKPFDETKSHRPPRAWEGSHPSPSSIPMILPSGFPRINRR